MQIKSIAYEPICRTMSRDYELALNRKSLRIKLYRNGRENGEPDEVKYVEISEAEWAKIEQKIKRIKNGRVDWHRLGGCPPYDKILPITLCFLKVTINGENRIYYRYGHKLSYNYYKKKDG